MNVPILQLVPAVYSRSKKVEALRRNLKIAPRQLPNSREAIAGHVADFKLADSSGSPYGTLPEWCKAYQPSQVVVHCTNGKVFIQVDTDDTGHVFNVRGHTIA